MILTRFPVSFYIKPPFYRWFFYGEKIMKEFIENLGFILELPDKYLSFNYENIHKVEEFARKVDDFVITPATDPEVKDTLIKLNKAISAHKAKTHNLTNEELKEVYLMLKDRQIHPKGTFDKMGRFYLEDYDLVKVKAPSLKYPYTQMNAGRTAKFVKAIANKYNCQTKTELLRRFDVSK